MSDTALDTLVTTIAEEIARRVRTDLDGAENSRLARVHPVLLTVKEAAVYLGRSAQSIQHLIFQRAIPVVRIGRRVHLDRRDLDTWIEQNKY